MDEIFHTFYANGALLVMWGALLFHLILPIPRSAHPVTLWHKFAEILADKVNTNASYAQSQLSGTLAWLLMILPTVVVCVALKPLVWQPQLFELALLLLALDWRSQEQLANRMASALAKDDKKLARSLLMPYVNRDTSTLSPLGLGKAGAETVIMGFGRNVVCVLFWYALLGGIGAFIYRLMVELARAWSPSRARFQPFGLPVVRAVAVLEFVPLRLFSLLIIVGNQAAHTLQNTLQQSRSWPLPGPGWLLCAVGNKLELSLGGPAIYGEQKAVRVKIGGRIAPSAIHLSQVHTLLAWRIFAWIILQSLLLLVIHRGV
ncbi:cobalamin biosynthesis family protein [Vibrio fluvialis]|uniref:cobalamin biosynthesis family protein n=1 Tax=Vibrio sp. bablab_jr001 TaxID=2755067 RepID=UPI0018F23099|nr:cobalamin biosynthesis family protein [Vibrio sp. bablab_jr001]EKO3398800.1 cobalamin biosynthesis family protein [Vibrio fluvialis]EKO3472890.1 cobalamin biosynthesis family protein [Vibrio fluvialis]MBY8115590.1 cobalamin biosynthesis family protein [Vibrio fluvialis]MBY8248671.1 cobalamin biosynthesis family protein [Vibrio fluvialis]MBY8282351.1 cobalamin biosynthesis family protein [Vibrio fluvialis]